MFQQIIFASIIFSPTGSKCAAHLKPLFFSQWKQRQQQKGEQSFIGSSNDQSFIFLPPHFLPSFCLVVAGIFVNREVINLSDCHLVPMENLNSTPFSFSPQCWLVILLPSILYILGYYLYVLVFQKPEKVKYHLGCLLTVFVSRKWCTAALALPQHHFS